MATKSELLYLVLQLLKEEGLTDAVHALERTTGLYFDVKHFEELVLMGEWQRAEEYLLGFTGWEANGSSLKMFFELRKQKYLEALDRRDHSEAVKILKADLRIFQTLNNEIYQELTSLLALDDFRQNEKLSVYGTTANARALMLQELRNLIDHNPALRGKMEFPPIPPSALASVFTQLTANPAQQAAPPMGLPVSSGLAHMAALAGVNGRLPDPAFLRGDPHAAALQGVLARGDLGRSPVLQPELAAASVAPQHTRSPHLAGRKRALGPGDMQHSEMPLPKRGPPAEQPLRNISNEVPSRKACTVSLPSPATSCDFHPILPSLLLVGTASGHAQIWALGPLQCLHELPCSTPLLRSGTPVTRVVWSPDGTVFGVAFHACKGRGVVHLYHWSPQDDQAVAARAEIDAHEGGVNDLALAHLDTQLIAVSGGSDAKVKVWSAATSELLFCFTGHEGPVYSVCPHVKGNISFVFSTGRDGRIKAWLYDSNVAAVVDYSAAGTWWTHMQYSTDGARLFSCGVAPPGVGSTLVEWNESDGAIARRYAGFCNSGQNLARFDCVAGRYLIVGDEGLLKVWHMDRPGEMLLLPVKAELPPNAVVRVNRPASLVAVSTAGAALTVLADASGFDLLAQPLPPAFARIAEARISAGGAAQNAAEAPAALPTSEPASRGADSGRTVSATEGQATQDGVQSAAAGTLASTPGAITAVLENDGGHSSEPIEALMVAKDGDLVLAATVTGRYHLWNRTAGAYVFKGTCGKVVDVRPGPNGDKPPVCLAVSRNGSYLLTAAGGRVTLFNLVTSKEIAAFQEKPPAATALAVDPHDNNLIALGLDDGTIAVYNVRQDSVQWASKKTHKAAVTGLLYLEGGAAVVTTGADAQVCFWATGEEEPNSFQVEARVRLRATALGGVSPAEGVPVKLVPHPTQEACVLAVHPQQLALYSRPAAACTAAWAPYSDSPIRGAALAAAAFGPGSSHIYAVLTASADVAVFTADSLQPMARVSAPGLAAALTPGVSFTAISAMLPPTPNRPPTLVLATSAGQVLTVAADQQRLADGGRARVKDEAVESQADVGVPKQEAPPNGPEAAAA